MRKTICDGCNQDVPYECTTLYARLGGLSKKVDLCAICLKKLNLEGLNWQIVKK